MSRVWFVNGTAYAKTPKIGVLEKSTLGEVDHALRGLLTL